VKPIKRVVTVEGAEQVRNVRGQLTLSAPTIHLDCGHSYRGNPIYTYPLGDWVGCASCPPTRSSAKWLGTADPDASPVYLDGERIAQADEPQAEKAQGN